MLIITVVLLVLSGCATGPRKIAPDYVSPLEYQNYSCAQLGVGRTIQIAMMAAVSMNTVQIIAKYFSVFQANSPSRISPSFKFRLAKYPAAWSG